VNGAGDENFQRGLSALHAGNLKEAERLLLAVTRAEPNHVPALNLLGVVLGRLGRNAEAVASYDRALAFSADSAEAWYGRGMTLLAIGRPQDAIASFDRVLAVKPDFAQVHLLRAKLLSDLGRPEAALEAIDKLLAIAPGIAEAWLGRSNILFAVKRYDEALSAADRAVAAKPDLPESWHGRGNALNELKRHDEALAACDKALALKPNFAGAWHGRGNALNELKRYDEALRAYEKALALDPVLAEAWLGRGNVLNVLKRCKEALVAFDRAEAAIPNLAEAWLGRGNSLCELNRYPDALIAYEKALALNRDLAEAWFGSGNILVQLKEHDKALAAFDSALSLKPGLKFAKGDWIRAKLQISDWTNLDAAISELITSVKGHELSCAPFQFLGISASPVDQLQCTKRFMADQPAFPAVWRGEIYAHDRIRLGYFSADFCSHPVAQLAVGLFEAHDKSRFETIAISFGPDDGSELRRRIKSAFEVFIDVREMSDVDVAALIRRRELDVIVDLTGLTRYNRSSVLSRRVAPVQVNFLGYPGTMGAVWMDYIIADRTIIPEEHFQCFSENVVWLPDTYQANDDKRQISECKPTRSECGLPENAFVFCCFNNIYKITPEIFEVWMRLLAAKPDSVLWLIGTHRTAEANLRREAEQRGIPSSRLIFAPKIPLADHLARSAQADLFLDTMPYNAHTTGSDALWAGVPVLTCLGSAFASRVGASLVRAVGLDELVTTSLQDYQGLALKLASDPFHLRALRDRLARNRKTYPLFDTARFARHIEAAYTTMWQRYQSGQMPQAFAVAETRTMSETEDFDPR
jgi:predicted O-linked N-acetylglucosamine transferase (SPINDLY family)